jgi:hypothetical protein
MIKGVSNFFYTITNGNNNEITTNNNTIGQNNKNYNNNTIDNYNNNTIENNEENLKIHQIDSYNKVNNNKIQTSYDEETVEVNVNVEGKSIQDKINILKYIIYDKTISVKNYVIEGNFSVDYADSNYISIYINGEKETITDNNSQQDSKPSNLANNLSDDGYIISNNGVNNKHNNENINNKNNNNRITFKALMEAVYAISGKTTKDRQIKIFQIICNKPNVS